MIIQAIFNVIMNFFKVILGWLPIVTELPFGMDEIFVDAVGMFKSAMALFPPLQVVFTAFMVYLSFRLALIVLRLFIGHRAPSHD